MTEESGSDLTQPSGLGLVASPAALAHLQMTQDIISRMARNSRNCKHWTVGFTIVAMFLGAMESPRYMLAAGIILPALVGLDAYYLALERSFRDAFSTFVHSLHQETLTNQDLIQHRPQDIPAKLLRSLTSFSIYGFYLPMLLTIALVWLMLE